jgi:NurA-like 5'-3' nuclease
LLKEVYLDAFKTRELKISKIKDSSYPRIISQASSRWIPFNPSPTKCESAGVDSSWNKRAFQGFNLYVVNAVAVTSANKILATEYEYDIAESARREDLESIAMAMEASLAQKVVEKQRADVICIDGSIVPRLKTRNVATALELFKKYEGVIFVSKSSETRSQFGSMGSRAGDIYYYDHASKSAAGFSIPAEAESAYGHVFETYARLREHTPITRIEVIGNTSEAEVKGILDRMNYHSVSGYPYCLKLAHNNCKISNEDIDRLASIFSLQHEQGARDALGE